MADRKCSYCGQTYTDETGHDYDACVKACQERVEWTEKQLVDARWALEEAKKVQVQTWWRENVAKDGDLRVWWIRNVPGKPEFWKVKTVGEAVDKLIELEKADLADKSVVSNVGGLEVYEECSVGGWTWSTWYDKDGKDVHDLIEAKKVAGGK